MGDAIWQTDMPPLHVVLGVTEASFDVLRRDMTAVSPGAWETVLGMLLADSVGVEMEGHDA